MDRDRQALSEDETRRAGARAATHASLGEAPPQGTPGRARALKEEGKAAARQEAGVETAMGGVQPVARAGAAQIGQHPAKPLCPPASSTVSSPRRVCPAADRAD